MEVSGGINDSQRVVELSRLIAFLFDVIEKILEIVIGDRELVE